MADATLAWLVEEIPDGDSVFMRAHRNHISNGELGNGVFPRRPDGLSADWGRYSTAEETRARATSAPNDNAVISLLVGCIRQIQPLIVSHAPILAPPEERYRAHSLIKNLPQAPDLTEVRFKLRKCAQMAIPLE